MDLNLIANLMTREQKLIRKGGFGEIYCVENDDGITYCLKKEKYMKLFNHENIVKCCASGVDDNSNAVIIIMEYCSQGSLADIIKKRKSNPFTNEEVLHYFMGIFNGLSVIHSKGVIHRDIKPHNIFVDDDNTPQIGDFGLSIEISGNDSVIRKSSVVGTENYLAPEILENKEYSFKSDMWALGVVLYELCKLKRPFENKDEILHKELPDDVEGYSDEIREMIKGLLNKNPNERKYNIDIDDYNYRKDLFNEGMNSMLKYDYNDAMRRFEESFCRYANISMKADIHKNIGYCYFQKKEYEKAEEYYQAARQFIRKCDKERKYEVNVNCGNIYYCRYKDVDKKSEEYMKIIENYLKAIDYYGNASSYASEKNMIFLNTMIRKSKMMIEEIIEKNDLIWLIENVNRNDPNEMKKYSEINYVIGKYRYCNEDYRTAIFYLNNAYVIYKNNVEYISSACDILLLISMCYIELEEYDIANQIINDFEHELQSDHQKFQYYNILVRITIVYKDYEKAKRICRYMSKTLPMDNSEKCEFYIRCAILYSKMKDMCSFRTCCNIALKCDPSRLNRCRIFIIKGNNSEKIEKIRLYKIAIEYASGSLIHKSKFLLAQAYYNNELYDSSVKYCKEIYDIVPDRSNVEFLLMHNYSYLQNYDECKMHYEKLKENREDEIKVEKHWIKCLKKMDRIDEAKMKFKEIVEKYQSDKIKQPEVNELRMLLTDKEKS